ncbi:MAG TPA: GNAT family N-acetyltransferase [Roseiflexaceae bacterium]|nr:GNAT family N-acetyltransferase [Roseiflexaceae bacterium]
MTSLTIGAATDDDLPAALEVIRTAFAEHEGVLDPPSSVTRETLDSFRARMGAGRLLVAEADGQTVGCVLCRPEEDFVYFGRLAVLPAWRGRGIARQLVEHVEAEARAWGLWRVQLATRIALPHLRASYERMGYRVVSAHAHAGYSAPTYITMEKDLTAHD